VTRDRAAPVSAGPARPQKAGKKKGFIETEKSSIRTAPGEERGFQPERSRPGPLLAQGPRNREKNNQHQSPNNLILHGEGGGHRDSGDRPSMFYGKRQVGAASKVRHVPIDSKTTPLGVGEKILVEGGKKCSLRRRIVKENLDFRLAKRVQKKKKKGRRCQGREREWRDEQKSKGGDTKLLTPESRPGGRPSCNLVAFSKERSGNGEQGTNGLTQPTGGEGLSHLPPQNKTNPLPRVTTRHNNAIGPQFALR